MQNALTSNAICMRVLFSQELNDGKESKIFSGKRCN